MKSIQTKFVVLILGCMFCAVLISGGVGLLTAKKVVDEDSAKIMNLICAENAQGIDAQLSRIEQSVRTLAVYAATNLESVERLKTDPAYLQAYTKQLTNVAINAASNTEGAMAVYVRFNPEFTPPTSGLFWSKTTLDGSFRPLTPTDFSRFNPQDTEHVGWYYIPIKSGKATWLSPYLNKNINVEMISFVIPLYMDNQTVGVVGMDIDFSILTDIVKSMQVYKNGYAFLTDKAATILYHKEFPTGTHLADVDNEMQLVATEIQSGNNGSLLFPYIKQGTEYKMAMRTLSNDMRLAITAPIKEIDVAKNDLIVQIVFVLFFVSAIAVFITVVFTRRLIRPLKELNVAAQKIAAGDLTISLPQQTKDEVGTLAESFQQTVTHLQKYINYINGLAYRDSLTGVKNKTAFTETEARLEEQMRLARPEFALVVLDLNGLKIINDTCGHDFGDMLLIQSCQIICKTFQHSPVYRIGGDEFVVVLEGADYTHYPELLKKLEEEITAHNKNARTECKISIARGIAVYNSATDLVFANVFKRADDAMYQNKAALKAQEMVEATE